MAFVTCGQFKESQEEQDKNAISAEAELLDKSSGVGAGKVTVKKIKEAVAGDVEVAVKQNSGISGDGTKDNPLNLKLDNSLAVNKEGKIGVSAEGASDVIGDQIAGSGLYYDPKTNKLNINLVRLMDASGTVHVANVVAV